VAVRGARQARRAMPPGLIPARLKPFALKFFFSNQYLYAHVQRRADGVVRTQRSCWHAHAFSRA
jgi:hypothetical protein